MSSDGYLLDLQCAEVRRGYSEDIACAVLDAIEAAGPQGADVESLVFRTHYDGAFLTRVLRELRNSGMTWSTADLRYRVTALGETVRSLASH